MVIFKKDGLKTIGPDLLTVPWEDLLNEIPQIVHIKEEKFPDFTFLRFEWIFGYTVELHVLNRTARGAPRTDLKIANRIADAVIAWNALHPSEKAGEAWKEQNPKQFKGLKARKVA